MDDSETGSKLQLKGKNAERFVYQLAQKSFLTDWCYKNPKLPDSKEICDLLVSYDDTVIIFQIKDLKLGSDGTYSQSKIKKNLRQLCGAKKSLTNLKIALELDNPRRGKESLDPLQIKKVYLISALLGEQQYFSTFVEEMKENIIHVFTREFTELVLNELDTIKDFIDYLREKEKLISVGKPITLIGGEKELLAYYLANGHGFENLMKADYSIIEEGCWDNFQTKPEYIKKKEQDKISYGWDDIINRAHTAEGKYEIIARELARANRFERRLLSEAFFEANSFAHNEKHKNIYLRTISLNSTTYCFVFMDDETREKRQNLLRTVCFMARGVYKNAKVIGVATEMKIRPINSYDFCLFELSNWTDTEQKEMERLQKELGIFQNPKMKYFHENEYPNENEN